MTLTWLPAEAVDLAGALDCPSPVNGVDSGEGAGAPAAPFGRRRRHCGSPSPADIARRGLQNDVLQHRMERLSQRISERRSRADESAAGESAGAGNGDPSGQRRTSLAGAHHTVPEAPGVALEFATCSFAASAPLHGAVAT